jgi:hypothetical protein
MLEREFVKEVLRIHRRTVNGTAFYETGIENRRRKIGQLDP